MGHTRKLKRRHGIWFDYNRDGMSHRERIKGFWKRYWRKWLTSQSKKDIVEREME